LSRTFAIHLCTSIQHASVVIYLCFIIRYVNAAMPPLCIRCANCWTGVCRPIDDNLTTL